MGQGNSIAQVQTHDSIETLHDELRRGQLDCPRNKSAFIPINVFDEKITAERVLTTAGSALGSCASYKAEQIVQRAKKTFAILVLSGCESIAYDLLIRDGMTDAHLPLSRSIPDSNILGWAGPQEQMIFESFATLKPRQVYNFCHEQWLALAPNFGGSEDHKMLCSKHPLPFRGKETIASTEFSTVFKTTLHPAHYNKGAEKDGIEVAVKELMDKNKFEQERRNLTIIGNLNNPHLIKHIATYEVQNPDGSSTYSIIFPLASGGNLHTFWITEDREPRTPEVIQWSLEQMLGLAKAVRDLHKGFKGERHCRHGDLKPLNILHFKDAPDSDSKGRGLLVIGDLGISKIHDEATDNRDRATLTKATTPDYEPPEARGIRHSADGSVTAGQGKPWSRKYDMWSLGCIFLEFAVWLFHDVAALDSFRMRRGPGPFYETRKVGDEVRVVVCQAARCVIEELQGDVRCCKQPGGDSDDAVPGPLKRFLDLIEGDMLVPEAEGRCDADRLVAELEGILEEARQDPAGHFQRMSNPPACISASAVNKSSQVWDRT
ncbi:kinase-like domain-containing protein [Achaetomium macrosporum]|uniref:Kinase-like domain-containing protein n=1 Tax=Achaetomium macrosporum TaxID=79813 RepID=A0AAN7H748_9PEZI|nr:kinase-like domain-containing protein [Achaetomium macrosporum]